MNYLKLNKDFTTTSIGTQEYHAQLETQEYARAIGSIMEELYPVSWEALNEQ